MREVHRPASDRRLLSFDGADAATVFAVCLVIVVIFGVVDRLLLRPLAARFSKNRGVAS